MINSKKYKHNQLLRDIQNKIEFKRQINVFDLEKLLELNYEIVFEYDGNTYEIVQNANFIELHYNCYYEDNSTKSLFCVKFTDSKEFIENARISNKPITQIINDIRIISC